MRPQRFENVFEKQFPTLPGLTGICERGPRFKSQFPNSHECPIPVTSHIPVLLFREYS